MYIRIRKEGETKSYTITLSKKSKIEELRALVFEYLEVEISKQRLIYQGKVLVDGHSLLDYSIKLNDLIQLIIREECVDNLEDPVALASPVKPCESKIESKYFKIGDRVDVRDVLHGAWFEGLIINISKNEISTGNGEKKLHYKVQLDDQEDEILEVTFDDIRPAAHYEYSNSELFNKMHVLVNYNIVSPEQRGYWYDSMITKVNSDFLEVTIYVGREQYELKNCIVQFMKEVFKIEKPVLLAKQEAMQEKKCERCMNVSARKCKACGCSVCGGKNNPESIILCDECEYGYHIGCLNPPLLMLPDDEEWYCPHCKTNTDEIVKAGDKLKSSKKSKRPSAKDSSRDWGKGMACVGRMTECTLVPIDHFGPIPGIEVGTCWEFRFQVSEAGVHRSIVAGIHGREAQGAFSLVLSGGYEDDVDNGNEFFYTGSGGRDLSGNKRVSEQSCDQTITRMNRALALNCNTKLNVADGGEAENWKEGKPVRVVRNYKLKKHSKYAPVNGNRYDGIYKVVKYYPEKGKSGFIVWRYLLRRDDNTPAPWEENGTEYDIIYPPGHFEAEELKNEQGKRKGNRGVKRSIIGTQQEGGTSKRSRVEPYVLSDENKELISKDDKNEKLWEECVEELNKGKNAFLSKVEDTFMCVCCQEIVCLPITTDCKHNICQTCLKRSFCSDIFSCPYCRNDLGKDYKIVVNNNLTMVLLSLFPGYEVSR